MDKPPVEHRTPIHEARNSLGDVISRARYAGEATILTNRGKEAAVIVSYGFYEHGRSVSNLELDLLRTLRAEMYRLIENPAVSEAIEQADPNVHLLLKTGGFGI